MIILSDYKVVGDHHGGSKPHRDPYPAPKGRPGGKLAMLPKRNRGAGEQTLFRTLKNKPVFHKEIIGNSVPIRRKFQRFLCSKGTEKTRSASLELKSFICRATFFTDLDRQTNRLNPSLLPPPQLEDSSNIPGGAHLFKIVGSVAYSHMALKTTLIRT